MKVEVTVLGFPSQIVCIISLYVKQHLKKTQRVSKLRICVKVEVAVLGSRSVIVCIVSVDVKQHLKNTKEYQSSGIA